MRRFASLLLILVAVLPFWINKSDYFLSDDWDFLMLAQQPASLSTVFTTNYLGTHEGGSYRPLVSLFWNISYHFFGFNPTGYHLLTIGFHSANTLLLFWLVHRLVKEKTAHAWEIAFLSGLLFAVFPSHAEAVAWLAVNDPMMTMFYLGSLSCLLPAVQHTGRVKWARYAASLPLLAAALFTKEMALTLPAVAFMLLVIKLPWKRALAWVTPHVLMVVGFFVIRYAAIGLLAGYYGPKVHLTLGLIYRSVMGLTLSNLFADQLLSNLMTLFVEWRVAIVILTLFTLAGLLFLTVRQKGSWLPWLFLATFLISLVPVISFGVNHTPTYFSSEGERYAYLPSVFLSILLASIIVKGVALLKRRFGTVGLSTGVGVIALLLVFLGWQLSVKTARWHQASVISHDAVTSALAELTRQPLDAVVFIGVPDNFHGAMMFRNNFVEALKLNAKHELPVLLGIFSRTAYEDQPYTIARRDQTTLLYQDPSGHRLLARPTFTSGDYNLTLQNYLFEANGINHRYFGRELTIELHEILLQGNQISVFFYQPTGWQVVSY